MKRNTNRLSDPQNKVLLLLRKAEALFASDLERSASLCIESITISKSSKRKDLVAVSNGIAGKCFLVRAELKRSAAYFEQARRYYEKTGDADAALDMEHNIISSKLFAGNQKELLVRLHQILSIRTSTPYQISKPQIHEHFFIPRSWEDRIMDKIPAPKEIEKANQLQLAELYGTLSRTYTEMKDKKGLSYLEEELSIADTLKNTRLLAVALNNLGIAYTIFGNNALAMEYLLKALKVYRRLGHKRGEAAAKKNLAKVYLQTGQLALGKKISKEALRSFSELKMWEAASRTLVTLATHERLYGSLSKADQYISEALHLWEDREKSAVYYYITLQQLLIEHAYTPSLSTYKKLVQLHKTIKEKGLALQKDAAQEIARVAQELRLHPESLRWLKIVHGYEIDEIKNEQKNIILSLETHQEQERSARQQEVQKLKMENLELELKSRTRENELMAVQIAKKGSFLATLTDQLASMKSSSEQYSPQTIQAVVKLIESVRFKDKEYENLEEQAHALHHDFIVSLSERYPKLTATEKRVCVLLRLGLNTKDIANVLFASVRTVESHCLNIRRKLRIPKKTRLPQYLMSLTPGIASA